MRLNKFTVKNLLLQYLIILGCVGGSFPVYGVGSIQGLGFLNEGTTSQANGISANGKVVVGEAEDGPGGSLHAYRWIQGNLDDIGTLNNQISSQANGVNADGSVIVGSFQEDINGPTLAFRWTSDGRVSLIPPNQGKQTVAYGVNANGEVVVGVSDGLEADQNIARAFRWTESSGMVSLGSLNGGGTSTARGVSADGTVIVGQAEDGTDWNTRAFLWTPTTNMINLSTTEGLVYSTAMAVNANGSVVVGEAIPAQTRLNQAYRWTQATGIKFLGTINEGPFSSALGVSADGSVVVGKSLNGDSRDSVWRGFRWTEETGMQTIEDWLGIKAGDSPVVETATAVNADGSVVVGALETGEGFIARGESGLITLSELNESLESINLIVPLVTKTGSLIVHGANGYPLSKLLTEKEDSCAWMIGDWGSIGAGGRVGLAEVGTCHRFTDHLQANIGIGKDRASQHLSVGGKAILEGNYLLVELMRELPFSNVWMSVSGLYHGGKLNIRRGYRNAGVADSSSGESHTKMPGIRSRLDWKDSLQISNMALTPYLEISHLYTKLEGYAENGGGFPAAFNERKEHITETRLGIYGRLLLLASTHLLGRIEGVHRFQKNDVSTTGELVGLFNLDVPGQEYQRHWLRGSLGINYQQDHKIASLMMHATTHGQDPKFWIFASYAVKF